MKTLVSLSTLATALVLFALDSSHLANASQAVHPDCVDNDHPVQCTALVEDLEAELTDFRQVYSDGGLDEMTSFYRSSAVVQVFGQFFRGKESIRNDLLSTVDNVDWELNTRFQVIGPDLIVQYGQASGFATFKNGFATTLNENVIVTWTRNPGDHERPFLIASGYYEIL